MKLLVMTALLMVNLFANDIAWNDTFAATQKKAKKESKLMLVIITTEECRWCRKLEATTLSDDKIASKINTHFASVHLTRDKSAYPKNLTAKMVPMSYFLDANGKVVHSMPGYWSIEDYDSILDDALRKAKK